MHEKSQKFNATWFPFNSEYEMVFCFQNCSNLLWEKIVLVIEKNFWNSRLKAENLQKFETAWTFFSNSERSALFLKQNAFLTCSWRFLRTNIFIKASKSQKHYLVRFLGNGVSRNCFWDLLTFRTIKIKIGKNYWDSEICRKS